MGATLPITRESDLAEETRPVRSEGRDGAESDNDSDVSDSPPGENLSAVKAGILEECKLVRAGLTRRVVFELTKADSGWLIGSRRAQ